MNSSDFITRYSQRLSLPLGNEWLCVLYIDMAGIVPGSSSFPSHPLFPILICFVDLLEVQGAIVTVTYIRVMLKSESSVCILDLMHTGARAHSQGCVVILH
jgi:hypothetical protein